MRTPPVSLQPIADAQHTWVAMLLRIPLPAPDGFLPRLFGELGLGDALGGLPCIIPGPWTEAELAAATGGFGHLPGPELTLDVDSYDDLRQRREAGFTQFAGSYPLAPEPRQHPPRGSARHALLLRLLALITQDGDSHEIEGVIKQDAQLSYQLLRLVNSVAFSLDHHISTFGQAIAILGRRQLQRWVQLLLYTQPANGGRSPLLPRAALRAALMEELCGCPDGRCDHAFMVGMFSLLDVLLATDMKEILAPLHLADEIDQALLEHAGPLGSLLCVVKASEGPDLDALTAALAATDIDTDAWNQALIRASRWAIRVSHEA
jgi:EAL and modified HD-GYP domain-containing signal transduction protein